MSQIYARVVGGEFTTIRYQEEALRFSNTIAVILADGDEIYPVIDPLPNTGTDEAPVFRAPAQVEIDNKVMGIADLAKPLYHRDMGVAGGVATLDESGDVFKTQIPDEVVEYLGTWDPRTNTPMLQNGVGNIGDSYAVHEDVGNQDYEIDLGGGPIYVRSGMTIIFRADVGDEANGHWYVKGSSGLSDDDRFLLENSLQNIKVYDLTCVPAAPAGTVGDVIFAQLASENNPYPEYTLVDADGLTNVSVNAISGELRIDSQSDIAGTYDIKVQVGGQLGQTEPMTVTVAIAAAV